MTGSGWTAFFALLLVEAGAIAVLVAVVMRERPASRRAGSLVVLAVMVAPLTVVLHELLSALIGGEEAITFVVALLVAPVAVVAGTFSVARALRSTDHEIAVGLGVAALGLALFPVYALVTIVAGPILRATQTYQGALEAVLLPMCLAVTAMGIAYTGIVLIRPRRALG